jgi:hypothetical protein
VATHGAGPSGRRRPPVLAFLFQVLNGAKTLRAGVADILADLVWAGMDEECTLPSADPSAF